MRSYCGPGGLRHGASRGWLRPPICLFVLAGAALVLGVDSRGATGCANAVVCENQQAGTPKNTWDVTGAGDSSIQGFATDISTNKGGTVSFKVTTTSSGAPYRIDIYRLGYYQGNGARLVTSLGPFTGVSQPACLTNSTGLADCGNWSVSATWQVPVDAASGIYVARPTRTDTLGASHIPFVVRDDAGTSDVLFQTADQTWQAYNRYGGNSLYTGSHSAQGNPAGRAYKVSYNRPITTRAYEPASGLFGPEFPMVRWLERNGYDVSYTTGVDAARNGTLIAGHKVYMSVGHDEYWSGPQRANVESARDKGVNLAFFSGNEAFWKTRWETSIDGAGTAYRTLVCYKETAANAKIDPDPSWTGTWRDARFSPPSDGGRPENGLTGTIYETSFREDPIVVPAAYAKLRFWRSTTIANLTGSQTASLPTGVLGYEWDVDVDNGSRPAGLFDMSSSTFNVNMYFDNGSAPGTATHSLTQYRARSGALVFGAGTIQWSYGLDDVHDPTTSGTVPSDTRMQQATVNVLADMRAQPATIAGGLVAQTASTDATPPTSNVTSAPASVTPGNPVTVSGTASDVGGVVAGVEVSVDAGVSWHPAAGTTSWSYTFTPASSGSLAVQTRAVDDSGNLDTGAGASECPCSLWSDSATPGTPSAADPNPIELGVKFRSDTAGYISGIRFYKGPTNTGTHVGHLWSGTGALLATATFMGETAAGWQRVSFATPVAVSAGTTYVASYYAPNGGYAVDRPYFAPAGVDEPPLHALADAVDDPNGVYAQGGNAFPLQTYNATNYWVDVVFDTTAVDRTPPTVVSTTPATSATGVSTGAAVVARFSESMASPTISSTTFKLAGPGGTPIAATVSYDASSAAATLQPSAPLAAATTYTATVKGGAAGVTDTAGNALAADRVWSFTTAAGSSCPCTIWNPGALPATASSGDSGAYELGVKFRSDQDGYVTGVRFYKGPTNGGVHVAHLWTRTGALLASATFMGESASGWQQVSLSSAVAVAANTTYVVSYTDPNGAFAVDHPYFAPFGVDNGPLHALGDGVDGQNSVYSQGGGGFPVSSYDSSNYWVDVVFDTSAVDRTPPTVSSTTPAAGASGVGLTGDVVARFSEAMAAASVSGSTVQLRDAGGGLVPASVSYDASAGAATLHPAGPLAASTTYTATVKGGAGGVADLAGNALAADKTWSFTTAAPAACPCTIWTPTTAPATASVSDGGAYELGVKFRSDQDGWIKAIRFYKGAANTGTHVGHLWSAGGGLLATATFGGETASGWQQVTLASPVAVTAGTTYVASYTDPKGGFALDRPYFTNGVDKVPLHALADGVDGSNGVYGAAGAFPSGSFQASNYWVDVVFDTSTVDNVAPTVSATTPVAGATGVLTSTDATVRFSEPMAASTISSSTFQLRDGGGNLVAATVSYDAATMTATLHPTSALAASTSYTATMKGGAGGATDLAGNPLAADRTWTFTTVAPAPVCPCTIWSTAASPSTASVTDVTPIEVGLKFRSDTAGYVSGMRFFKGIDNTGTHVGHLWTGSGTLLSTATFANESTTGWQEVTFPAPVAVAANTTYVISYYAPNGGHALDRPFFTAAVDNAPLHALADGADGSNGVFLQGADAFPTQSFNASNYWVDVVFDTSSVDRTAPTVTSMSPAANVTNAAATTAVSAGFSEAMAAASITGSTFRLRDSTGAVVPASVSYDSASRTATLQPSSPLAVGASYTAVVTGGAGGVSDLAGNALAADFTWSFTTANVRACPCSIWSATTTPSIASSTERVSYELGVRFRADSSGYITGIRYYRGPNNSGTHLGRLWTNAGTLLAKATFTGETATGWQQVDFASAVAVAANTTYVASYTAPNGGFALDRPYFTSPFDNAPLHALLDGFDGANGVYARAVGTFPKNSYQSSNYWVDVVYTRTAPPAVSTKSPAANATAVSLGATPIATFSRGMDPATITTSSFSLVPSGGTAVAATVTYDPATQTAKLTPAAPLAASTSYTVTLAKTIAAADGVPLQAPVTWSFTTGTS